MPPAPDPADLSYAALARRLDRVLMDPALADDNHWVNKARDLFEAQPDLDDAAAFRRLASVLANDLGQMRVRFNPQQHAVPVPYRDDNSYLWDHGESAQPPPEAHALTARRAAGRAAAHGCVAAGQRAAGCRRARRAGAPCLSRMGLPAGPRAAGLEHGDRARRARPSSAWPAARAAQGRAGAVAALEPGRRLRRQWEGDDIDLNAAIEVLVDRRLDLAPDARLFMRPGRQPCRCATLVLLDLSESANDLAAPGGPTVLDLEKRAALLLAGSLAGSGDGVAVHGFSSDTRAAVDYVRLLDFGESPLGPAAGRVEAARARHSTRLGAALRHAGELALRADAERHAIVVVTDGEPSDVDVHDPRYLVEDARAAALALRRRGLRVHCLALDARAAPQLRAMFGAGGYQLVTNPARLAAALARAYARIAAG